MKPTVEYLAFMVNRNGIPSPRKVQAIREVQVPENLTELKSFLEWLIITEELFQTWRLFEWFVSREHSVAMD